MAVFIPVLFLGGLIGRLFQAFAVTIGVAILVSGVVSLTLTPMLCSRWLKAKGDEEEKHGRFYRATERAWVGSLSFYERSLAWVMDRRGLALAFSAVILVGTVVLARLVPKGFIPSEDQLQLQGTTETAEGTSYDAMVKHQRAAAAIVSEDPNVDGFMSAVGVGGRTGTINQGRLIIHLKPRGERELSADEVARSLSQKLAAVPGMRVFIQNPPVINIGGRSSKSEYQFTLTSSDIEALYDGAAALERRLGQVDGLADVTSDLQIKNPQVRVEIARDRASALGIDVNQIESALYNAYGARQVSTIYTPNDQYWVVMELLPEYQRDLSAMNLLHLTGRQGVSVPLGSLAKVEEGTGPLTVNHSGQLPSVTLSFNLEPGTSIGTAVERVEAAAREVLPSTVSTSFAGTAQAFQQAQAGLLVLLVLAIVVIYLVLGMLYESFIHPLTILSGLPFAGFGALLALLLFGNGPQHLRLRRRHHAGRHREEERDHDDRLRDRGGAEPRQERPRRDPRGRQRSVPAHHDDHDGGADGHAADRAGPRRRRRVPAPARRGGGGRPLLLPDHHAVHHAGDLHLLRCAPAPAGAAQG